MAPTSKDPDRGTPLGDPLLETDFAPATPPVTPATAGGAEPEVLRQGEVLNDCFVIQSSLGRGGMGEVYLATDVVLDRKVAVKVLRHAMLQRLEVDARARREARLLSRLGHPHVVTVYFFGVSGGLCYMAMEYVERGDLGRYLRRDGLLSPADAFHVIQQIGAAVAHAHSQGVIHRDIKPENVLLARVANDPLFVKVADFGLAQPIEGVAAASGDGAPRMAGTPYYMAPEQILGRPLDQRCDIYALGVLAYELLTGVHPFEGSTPSELWAAHLNDVAPLPSLVGGPRGLGEHVDAVLLRALAKSVEDRTDRADVFVMELGEALQRDGVLLGPSIPHTSAGAPVVPARDGFTEEVEVPPQLDEMDGATLWAGCVVVAGALSLESSSRQPVYGGELIELVEEAGRRIRRSTEEQKGRLLHLVGGQFIALFGLDVGGQQAAEVAVDAALSIRTALVALERDPTLAMPVTVKVSMGIDCGRLIVPRRWDAPPVLDGEPLTRARRLADEAAHAEIRATERLLRRASSLYETEAIEQGAVHRILARKAVARPVPDERLGGATGRPFLGRELAMGILRQGLEMAADESRLVVVPVYGAPGTGKSRLVGELARELAGADEEYAFESARCSPQGTGSAYEPFVEIVTSRASRWGRDSGEPMSQLGALVEGLFPGATSGAVLERAHAIARLLGLRGGEAGGGWQSPAEAGEKHASFEALTQVFRRMAQRRPLVLHIDDFQWARDGTVELLSHMIRSLASERVLVVLGVRPERGKDPVQALSVPLERTLTVRMTPLNLRQVEELLRASLPEHAGSVTELAPATLHASAGVPLLIEEIVEILRASRGAAREQGPGASGAEAPDGAPHGEPGRTPVEALHLPVELDDIVLQRADTLSATERQILRRHAVCGPIAWRAVLEEGIHGFGEAWIRLRESGFLADVQQTRLAGEQQTAFRHMGVRETLYRHLRPSWRKREHGRVARWLVGHASHATEPLEELVAYHYEHAGMQREAGEAWLRAANRAMAMHAASDSLQQFQRAREQFAACAGDEALAGLREAWLGAAMACCWGSSPHDGLAWLERGLADARAIGPPGDSIFRARLCSRRAEVHELLGQFDQALGDLRDAEAHLASSEGAGHLRVGVLARRAMVLARTGQLKWAEETARTHLASPEAQDPEAAGARTPAERKEWHRAVGTLHAALGHALSWQGQIVEGEQAYERSRHHWEATGHPAGKAAALLNLGLAAWWQGRLDRARELWQQVARIYGELGSLHGLAMANTNLGELELRERDPSKALEHLRAAESTLRDQQSLDVLPETLRLKAEALLGVGDAKGAEEAAREALAIAESAGNTLYEGAALRALGRAQKAQGLESAALATLERARACFHRTGQSSEAALTEEELRALSSDG